MNIRETVKKILDSKKQGIEEINLNRMIGLSSRTSMTSIPMSTKSSISQPDQEQLSELDLARLIDQMAAQGISPLSLISSSTFKERFNTIQDIPKTAEEKEKLAR